MHAPITHRTAFPAFPRAVPGRLTRLAVTPVAIQTLGSAIVLAAMPTGLRAEGAAPLPVTVAVRGVETYLRAGPGDDFYPTDRLTRGATVEVWAIDGEGNCAVRPVEGSFSWVRADDLIDVDAAAGGGRQDRMNDEPLTAVVARDGAVARVGSQLNPLRHVSQVALEAGERVGILGRERIESGRHAGDWVRIAPPSGEFRWARGTDLDLPPPLAPDAAAAGAAGLAAAGQTVAAIREARDAFAAVVAAPAGPPPGPPAPPQVIEPQPGAQRLFGGWLPLGTTMFDSAPTPPVAVAAGAQAAPADELTDIDLGLSLAVTGPSDSWNLADLRARLRLAAARAQSEGERLRAQAIDARLARFEEIQARQRSLAAPAPAADPTPLRLGAMWSSLAALGSRPVRPGVLPGGGPADGQPTWTPPDQVEVTGRLATVISRRPDAPRWALVDDRNTVLTFVTPQAGVNLAPLVGQQVSVRGAKGFMPEYQRPYLVASEARTRLAAAPGAGPATR